MMVPFRYMYTSLIAVKRQKSRSNRSSILDTVEVRDLIGFASIRYCSRVWQESPDPKGIFLSLLRIYLRPSGSIAPLIDPALALIATHGTRIDASATIDLLPPLVTMKDVHKYFLRTLRDRHSKSSQAKITRALLIARRDQVDQTLTSCQEKRVRITDMRM
jgi:hypothetical protein